MLDAQVRLGHAARIDGFLAGLSAEGHYATADNAAIVRAAALLPPSRATDLLIQIVTHNASAHLGACGDLLLRCAAPQAGFAGDIMRVGAALIDVLLGGPVRRYAREPWGRRDPATPGFVVDLLTATSRIDAGLAARAIEHVLAYPEIYEPGAILVPAALRLARLTESAAWPGVRRLREAALEHLRKRIALKLEPPRDWTRTNRVTCRCADCRDLGAFLFAPDRREWRLKAVQDRRTHVEDSIRTAVCDLDPTTERRGSPHTLIAVENQASYQRRAEQRRQDLEHVAKLGG